MEEIGAIYHKYVPAIVSFMAPIRVLTLEKPSLALFHLFPREILLLLYQQSLI